MSFRTGNLANTKELEAWHWSWTHSEVMSTMPYSTSKKQTCFDADENASFFSKEKEFSATIHLA